MSHAIFVYERILPTVLDWVLIVSFFYDGVPFEYLYNICPMDATEQQAQDIARSSNHRLRAQTCFLRDVELGVMQ